MVLRRGHENGPRGDHQGGRGVWPEPTNWIRRRSGRYRPGTESRMEEEKPQPKLVRRRHGAIVDWAEFPARYAVENGLCRGHVRESRDESASVRRETNRDRRWPGGARRATRSACASDRKARAN